MESLMETLISRRADKDKGLMPISAPAYAQVRRAFDGLVRAIYRLEVVGADRLPVTGPVVVASNHDSVLDGIVLGAAVSWELRFLGRLKARLRQKAALSPGKWDLKELDGIARLRDFDDRYTPVFHHPLACVHYNPPLNVPASS